MYMQEDDFTIVTASVMIVFWLVGPVHMQAIALFYSLTLFSSDTSYM